MLVGLCYELDLFVRVAASGGFCDIGIAHSVDELLTLRRMRRMWDIPLRERVSA
jgi:hypothetical protein